MFYKKFSIKKEKKNIVTGELAATGPPSSLCPATPPPQLPLFPMEAEARRATLALWLKTSRRPAPTSCSVVPSSPLPRGVRGDKWRKAEREKERKSKIAFARY